MDSSLAIFSDHAFHKPDLFSSDLASALLLLLSGTSSVDSVITNVSVIQSWNWFFALTPFESIFLGFIIAQIAVLNVLGVLPIKLNDMFNGVLTGRKKRQIPSDLDSREEMAHTVVNVLKRMDRNECFVKALCLIQLRESSGEGYKLPKELKTILKALKISSDRRKSKQLSSKNEFSSALLILEEAVQIGLNACANPHSNSTVCEDRYTICPASRDDIYSYIDEIYTNFF